MSESPNVVIAVDLADLVERAASWVADRIGEAVAARGRCSVALAGGSTPRPVYVALARAPLAGRIAWDAVELFLGDERCVPRDHEASNYRMAREAFLEGGAARPLRLHEVANADTDAERAARDYEAR